MGNPKQKWTSEEEEALRAGVAKHGTGKWKNIQKDPEFNPHLYSRSNIDLKDKWRNMSVSANGQGPREKSRTPKGKTLDAPATPMQVTSGGCNMPAAVANDVVMETAPAPAVNDDSGKCLLDGKTASKYNSMIYEALSTMRDPNGSDISSIVSFITQRRNEVPLNLRRLISSRLRRLIAQEKIEKVQNCYRLKKDILVRSKPLTPKPKEIRPRQLQTMSHHLGDTVQEAAEAAAYKIAEAENKSYLAAEAVKDFNRVSKMQEEAECFLEFAQEILHKCLRGEVVTMAL